MRAVVKNAYKVNIHILCSSYRLDPRACQWCPFSPPPQRATTCASRSTGMTARRQEHGARTSWTARCGHGGAPRLLQSLRPTATSCASIRAYSRNSSSSARPGGPPGPRLGQGVCMMHQVERRSPSHPTRPRTRAGTPSAGPRRPRVLRVCPRLPPPEVHFLRQHR